MKTVTILSYPRTGSNWLSYIFGGKNTFATNEILCDNPLISYWNLMFLFENIYHIDSGILKLFKNIYHPNNFLIDTQIYKQIINQIHIQKPYPANFLQQLQKIVYNQNFNLVFKLFPKHIQDNDLTIDYLENISDYIIINYRNDILQSYISLAKAEASYHWTSTETKTKYQDKINWNINSYYDYMSYILGQINCLETYAAQIKKTPYIKISYESIHKHNSESQKIQFIYNTFTTIDSNFVWDFATKNVYNKENTIQNIEDNFYNPGEFLKDLPNIRRFAYSHGEES